jgi:Domain of unknown function (DUF5602)
MEKIWQSIRFCFLGVFIVFIFCSWQQTTLAGSLNENLSDSGLPLNQSVFVPATKSEKLIMGERKKIGDGFTQAWVVVDQNQKPTKIGITLAESSLSTAPNSDTSDPGKDGLKLKLYDGIGHSVFEYEVKLPEQKDLPFKHVTVDWNPYGHAPQSIFTSAHWDIHFYTVSPEYRQNIQQETPAQIAISNLPPAEGFLPIDYKIAPGTAEPRMGSHCADFTSSQLHPGKFDNTFIFGVHNAQVIFWEPMITNSYLAAHKTAKEKIKLPSHYAIAGYYPTTYAIDYDSKTKQFAISMNDLQYREANSTEISPPISLGIPPEISSEILPGIS